MTTQILERNLLTAPLRPHDPNEPDITAPRADAATLERLPVDFDIDAELRLLTEGSIEIIEDREILGQRIMQSAASQGFGSFAVKCRSVTHATDFSTPMRSMLLTLSSAFGGMSATISPSLNLHTWPAMDMLVAALAKSGAEELWQPIGERSISVGAARHIFVSVDNPVRDDATNVFPSLLVEIVGAHLIDPEWFDRVVAPRCRDEALTFVYYGQTGFEGSLFERAWQDCQVRGII